MVHRVSTPATTKALPHVVSFTTKPKKKTKLGIHKNMKKAKQTSNYPDIFNALKMHLHAANKLVHKTRNVNASKLLKDIKV